MLKSRLSLLLTRAFSPSICLFLITPQLHPNKHLITLYIPSPTQTRSKNYPRSPHLEVSPILDLLSNLNNNFLPNGSPETHVNAPRDTCAQPASMHAHSKQQRALSRSNSSRGTLKSKSKVRATASGDKYDRVEFVIQDGVINVISDKEAQV